MYTEYTPIKKRSFIERTFSKVEIGSVRGSIFTVIIGGLGSGLLSIPYAI